MQLRIVGQDAAAVCFAVTFVDHMSDCHVTSIISSQNVYFKWREFKISAWGTNLKAERSHDEMWRPGLSFPSHLLDPSSTDRNVRPLQVNSVASRPPKLKSCSFHLVPDEKAAKAAVTSVTSVTEEEHASRPGTLVSSTGWDTVRAFGWCCPSEGGHLLLNYYACMCTFQYQKICAWLLFAANSSFMVIFLCGAPYEN